MSRCPSTESPVVAVSGLRIEARIARGAGVRTVAGGGDPVALDTAIRDALDRGASGLVSFGIAGGLAPSLRPGTVVVANAVCLPDGTRIPTDPRWSARLLAALPGSVSGVLAGSDTVVAAAGQKAALHARSGAIAVDMESHTVARLAGGRALPFAVLRVVADPAARSLPAAATVAMRAGGGLDLRAVLRSLVGQPAQLVDLLRVARDTRSALAALARGRRRLGHGLGHPNLDQPLLDVV